MYRRMIEQGEEPKQAVHGLGTLWSVKRHVAKMKKLKPD